MRESRTYGSGRGACHEMHVPTATETRREFITLLGGAAAAWPVAARAQQPERMPRIGVITNFSADDPATQPRLTAFRGRLQQLGWTDGRNVRIDIRWSTGTRSELAATGGIGCARLRRHSERLERRPPHFYCGRRAPYPSYLCRWPIRWSWVCCEPRAARRQCHRICDLRIRDRREVDRTAEGDRPGRDAGGDPARLRQCTQRSPCSVLCKLRHRC